MFLHVLPAVVVMAIVSTCTLHKATHCAPAPTMPACHCQKQTLLSTAGRKCFHTGSTM